MGVWAYIMGVEIYHGICRRYVLLMPNDSKQKWYNKISL